MPYGYNFLKRRSYRTLDIWHCFWSEEENNRLLNTSMFSAKEKYPVGMSALYRAFLSNILETVGMICNIQADDGEMT